MVVTGGLCKKSNHKLGHTGSMYSMLPRMTAPNAQKENYLLLYFVSAAGSHCFDLQATLNWIEKFSYCCMGLVSFDDALVVFN